MTLQPKWFPYGFFRPQVKQVMERYLDCDNLLNGFARIKCEDCSHEYLLALVLEQSGNPAKGGTNAVTFAHQKWELSGKYFEFCLGEVFIKR